MPFSKRTKRRYLGPALILVGSILTLASLYLLVWEFGPWHSAPSAAGGVQADPQPYQVGLGAFFPFVGVLFIHRGIQWIRGNQKKHK